MTWSEFVASVRDRITVDADRLGPIQAGITRKIQDAVRDLQVFITGYREGHETLFNVADMTVYGSAHAAPLPSGARPREAYVYTASNTCAQRPVYPFPWDQRNELKCAAVPGVETYMAIDPYAKQFVLYPALAEGQVLQLWWDGVKTTFVDTDQVPFDELAAEAAAAYVKAYIAKEVDRDPAMSNEHLRDYSGSPGRMGMRTKCYLEMKDRTTGPIVRPPPSYLNCHCQACSGTDVEIDDPETTDPLPTLSLSDTAPSSDSASVTLEDGAGIIYDTFDEYADDANWIGDTINGGDGWTAPWSFTEI